jgi:lipopolysaccharide transport system ATP-binding protein
MINQMSRGTVEFTGVSKRYRLGTFGTLRGAVSALLSKNGKSGDRRRVLWALRDVTFRVRPGESLGLIGPNGSGKTTTLKLLSHLTQPTTGRIAVSGRVASLIELGAGFHPELTGLENIYLNGTILGLRRHEIRRKLDSIIAFSGLERFVDTPVKRYSSGMYVRLGFSVAAHVEADTLLVDEVLSVGDAEFRQRCIERMENLLESGTTLIFVSHNMYQVRRLCKRALLLVEGKPRYLGDTGEAISTYERVVQSFEENKNCLQPLGTGNVSGTVTIYDIALLDQNEQPVSRLRHDQTLKVCITYRAQQPIVNPIVRVRLVRSNGTVCAMAASAYEPGLALTLSGRGKITMQFDPVQLVSGRYLVEVRLLDTMDSMLLVSSQSEWFDVDGPAFGHEMRRGFFVPRLRWTHEPELE